MVGRQQVEGDRRAGGIGFAVLAAVVAANREAIFVGAIDTEAFRSFVDVVERECVGRTFYRKQLLSAFHLAFSQNGCNFSVPGAGKTSVVYAAYTYLRSLPAEHPQSVDRLLIIGPLSSFKAWEDEYASIFVRKAVSRRISGAIPVAERADHLRGITSSSRSTELTLTTYQTLAKMEEEFRTFLKHVGPRAMVVLDEAHYIKSGEDSEQLAIAVRRFSFLLRETRVVPKKRLIRPVPLSRRAGKENILPT